MSLKVEQLSVYIYPNRTLMGRAAALAAHAHLKACVEARGHTRVILSSAPSQNDFYDALADLAEAEPKVWTSAVVFHMDDYVGLAPDHAQSFSRYLQEHFFHRVKVAEFHPIRGDAPDAAAEAVRYGKLLTAAPIDLIGMGIGENGHIAFNDPPVADFNDPVPVKVVEMDRVCRQQQVNDGCFPNIDAVPRNAISITLPTFANAGMLSCHVPTTRKADAVLATLTGPVGTACPATLMRSHPNAALHLDPAAASLLPESLVVAASVAIGAVRG
ncbi:6-phosphogluconolactonase [Oleiharenicola lentus]|uniref:6-phosphogluconolactonase n=1 Tax=Oleiharenicola lentus TaxID=2508720 RepID=UPI003F668D2B